MSDAKSLTKITPDELLRMPDGGRYELVRGRLVELNTSMESSYVGGRLFHYLSSFCDEKPGWVFPADTGYRCFSWDPDMVRKPDISFIAQERYSLDALREEGYGTICPDLLAEVVSPHDLLYQLDQKINDYLEAGVKLIWVIRPLRRTVEVYRADGSKSLLGPEDELDGETIVPGFRCRVSQLFETAK